MNFQAVPKRQREVHWDAKTDAAEQKAGTTDEHLQE